VPGGLPFAPAATGVRLNVRLTPRAATERIAGLADEAGGGVALKIAVNAPPQDGKANAALLRLLARVLGLPQRDISIALGATQRRKVVHIAGDTATLLPRVAEALRPWLDEQRREGAGDA
jgi:uncharacterized protein (TIGR00251 family)